MSQMESQGMAVAGAAGQQEEARPRKELPRGAGYGYDPRSKSPLLAGFLSLMPGLGQVYVGYYQRGFVHILVAASVIALLANEAAPPLIPLLSLFLAFFWMYNVVDAARRASLYNMALQGTDPMALPEDIQLPSTGGSVAGGVALIGIGLILLMNTVFGVSLAWVKEWWPAAPVLLGVWLVYRGIVNGPGKSVNSGRDRSGGPAS